jgi:hypothetical protein
MVILPLVIFIYLQNKPPVIDRPAVPFGSADPADLPHLAKDARRRFSTIAAAGHRTRALMDSPQCFEGAHGTDQRTLLSVVIAPGIPQLAITKTQRVLRHCDSFRQFG